MIKGVVRRKSSVNATLVAAFKDVVYQNRRVTIRDVCELTGQSYGTVQRVITEELKGIPKLYQNVPPIQKRRRCIK